MLKTIIFDLHFAFSPLPDTSGRGWGWGGMCSPPLNVVLPRLTSLRLFSVFFVPLWLTTKSASEALRTLRFRGEKPKQSYSMDNLELAMRVCKRLSSLLSTLCPILLPGSDRNIRGINLNLKQMDSPVFFQFSWIKAQPVLMA